MHVYSTVSSSKKNTSPGEHFLLVDTTVTFKLPNYYKPEFRIHFRTDLALLDPHPYWECGTVFRTEARKSAKFNK